MPDEKYPYYCANYSSHKKMCNALDVKHCNPERCSFYIPFKKAHETLDEAYKRLNSLPPEEQARIAAKYFAGKRVWKVDLAEGVIAYDHN